MGEHRANGMIEAANKQVQGQIRVMTDALESRFGEILSGEHPCMPWLVRHAACTMNRRRTHRHGITPHRRWKGKEFRPLSPNSERASCTFG